MKKKWKECSTSEKVLLSAKLLISLIIVIAAALQLAHIWQDALYVTVPLLGVLHLLEGILAWNKDRDLAAFSFLCAGLILFATIAVYCSILFSN